MFIPKNYRKLSVLFFLAFILIPGFAEAALSTYAVVHILHLPGSTRWDYLAFDVERHRLFITRGESVDSLDIEEGKIAGTIPDTSGVHGVALAPELGRGFTSNGAANTSTVFDLITLKPLTVVPTGIKPDAIVYDPVSQSVFTANGGSNDMTVIDATAGMATGTIKLGGKPEFAVVDGKGHLYVNLEDISKMQVINTQTRKIIATYNLSSQCDGPTGLSIDHNLGRLFVSCHNDTMLVVDGGSGKIIDALPIGTGSDATVFDPETNLAFSSNGEGTLDVIGSDGSDHYAVLQTVKTVPTARTMALDPSNHRLYLAAAQVDNVTPVSNTQPHTHPSMKPDSFMIVVVEPR